MAVGLAYPVDIQPVPGIRIAAGYAGIRKKRQSDLVLIEAEQGSLFAATFTRNLFCAAPVNVAKKHLQHAPRFLLINAGNANAGTGEQGLSDARACCEALAMEAGCDAEQVLPFSTGVIGQRLPVAKFQRALPDLVTELNDDAWMEAALGIMTTDTVPKAVSKKVSLNNKIVTITGIAKGAGMIRPDMATMLAFIATDAVIDQSLLEDIHSEFVADSFNCITIDGDTSTNDACVLIATGKSEVKIERDDEFCVALKAVYMQLAQSIVRDGEGATKFVTVNIKAASNTDDAKKIAFSIAHSPLVKTALFASDANWGRILAAAGRSGADVNIDKVGISINDVQILSNGQLVETYTEEMGAKAMAPSEIAIDVQLGLGDANFTVWTCDFSHDYVSINADYRT